MIQSIFERNCNSKVIQSDSKGFKNNFQSRLSLIIVFSTVRHLLSIFNCDSEVIQWDSKGFKGNKGIQGGLKGFKEILRDLK